MDRGKLTIILILIAVAVAIGATIYIKYAPGEELAPEGTKTYCTPESRNADFCTAIYQPVCGWNNPTKVQCIKYPCAETYTSPCNACKNDNVEYWTPGECPAS